MLAAVDLGSNSFHMVVARIVNEQVQIVDQYKEMVRLAGGLDKRQRITKKAREKALDCLARFGQRLSGLPAENVRIVGTNTLRKARNSQQFMQAAEAVLGYPIEIISGME
ncbi:MAG TPA: exopolyphosphatase, partial [Gammaproteobacteria bacterium]|nr:exopolyphosphatase [Gammaproteobacteria bacterium]